MVLYSGSSNLASTQTWPGFSNPGAMFPSDSPKSSYGKGRKIGYNGNENIPGDFLGLTQGPWLPSMAFLRHRELKESL